MENDVIEIDVEKELISAEGRMKLHVQVVLRFGELVVLFGHSGAGKSTLLRILAGLTRPEKGFIRVGNTIWLDTRSGINRPPRGRNIGFMFQDYALFPNMSVLENITYAQKVKDKKLAFGLIEKFGLTELADRRPDKLSGGQKQRVALARALAGKPDFLLLDEPLSALDAKMRTTLQNEIMKAHAGNRITTMLVSHDLTEVFRLAGKVLKIEKGRITAMGKPDELFINNRVSGKVQITGHVVRIVKQDTFYVLTVVTGMNQIIKVTAFDNDVENLCEGDPIMLFTKAFNPIIMKM